MVPLYAKYYTLEDLKAINAFYESPVGQMMITTQPHLVRESMEIGRAWGQKIGREAAEEAQKEAH